MPTHTINTVHVLPGSAKIVVRGITHDQENDPPHRGLMISIDADIAGSNNQLVNETLRLAVAAKLGADEATVVFAEQILNR